ncbi:MAG TPA: hypothetical protein VNV82_15155 [Bryobacteraceae bacterium]|jgi:hypothetical protein|nr:hypothetical protein [Bryobacteraceae bacterium]
MRFLCYGFQSLIDKEGGVYEVELQADIRNVPDQRFSATDLRNMALILFSCCILGYLRWLKLDTLVWGDPALWLVEGQRAAAGEIPYRDFLWSYPPLSVLLLGWTMKLFGVAFTVAQVFVDLASLAVVVLGYALIRPLLPRFLHLPVMICLLSIGGTSLMFFSLFSFLTYVPALQIGAAGFLLLLIGVLSYVRTGKLSARTWLSISIGSFVAAYTKPETLLATSCTLGLLAAVDRQYWFREKTTGEWFSQYAKVAAACVAPVLVAYLWMGTVAGFRNMQLGITGYGLARTACPWWPTGVGIFGAIASLGEAAFIASILSLTCRRQFSLRFGRTYYYALAGGLAGACIFGAYVLYSNWNLFTGSRPATDKLWYSAPSIFWSNAVLLPVMWSSVLLWLWLLARLIRSKGRMPNAASLSLLILLTGPVAMSSRGWFNWHLGSTSTVPAICYPFFILLAPYLIWRFLAIAGPGFDLDSGARSLAGAAVVTLFIFYAVLRVAGGYSSLLSDRPYRDLSTMAGNIRLSHFAVDSEIFRFVLENSSPTDTVLDVPYGGGMNVATHRLSPLFTGQFEQLKVPDDLLEKDLEKIRAHPPKVVIAENQPNYAAFYGLEGCTCAFPHLVWIPETSSVVPDKHFPAIDYIQQNYRASKIIGPKLLLVPK